MSIPRLEKRQKSANVWMTAHGLQTISENNELGYDADDVLMAGRRQDNLRSHRLLQCEVQDKMRRGIVADRRACASKNVCIYWCSFVIQQKLTHQNLTRRSGWPQSS
jgi:hypothetical protein